MYKELGICKLFSSETVVPKTYCLTNKMLGVFKNRYSNNILVTVLGQCFLCCTQFEILHVVFRKVKSDCTIETFNRNLTYLTVNNWIPPKLSIVD